MFQSVFDATESNRTLKVLFGALVFVLGAQSMRFLFSSMAWYLRDTVGIGVIDLIPIALAPFILGALFPMLSRWLSVGGAIWVATLVLVMARVTNQIARDPSVELVSAGVATLAFVGLLPLLLSMGRSALVGGVLLGLAIDSALKGMGLSLDLAFQDSMAATAVVIGLGVATFYALWACPAVERQGVGAGLGWMLVGIGPFLFFQALILQNQGWVSVVTGMDGPQAQLVIALLNVVTLIAVTQFERSRLVSVLAVLVLVAALAVAEGGSLAFTVLFILAVPAAGLAWAAMVPDIHERGISASAIFLTLGATFYVILGLVYYVPLDLNLGFGQTAARIGALGLFGLIALTAAIANTTTRPGVASQSWAFAAVAALLPLIGLVTARVPPAQDRAEFPLTVMAYNIHSGFDTTGRFSIEDLAQVIADSRASLIGLQEVSRGQLITGVTDQLTLLQQRLGFEHVAFFGTTDPTWGNAILSRYPILSVETEYLPQVGTPLRRGYLAVTVDVDGQELVFISTHLQHVNDSSAHAIDPEADLYPVHHEQIATILSRWGGRQPAVLVGDFNARPGWRQLEELLAAGWLDAWDQAGVGPGYTANAANPEYRIDYVFHTSDLQTTDAGNIISQASDHFPVVAVIERD